MAERRMFAKSVIDGDDFLDMPSDAQLLYFHLSMRADDDGFITPKKIMRMIGASDDSLKILAAKRFIIPFESGVIVIRHWRINNFLRNDRYHETEYKDEKDSLELVNNKYEAPGSGTLVGGDTSGIPVVYQRYPQDRIGKDRIGKGNTEDSLRSSSSCTEPSTEDSVPESPPVMTIPTNVKGKEYPISQAYVDEMSELYPAVDVVLALRAMRGWALSNPTKRKTYKGMPRFINSWLAREQNKGGIVGQRQDDHRFNHVSTNEELRREYQPGCHDITKELLGRR